MTLMINLNIVTLKMFYKSHYFKKFKTDDKYEVDSFLNYFINKNKLLTLHHLCTLHKY